MGNREMVAYLYDDAHKAQHVHAAASNGALDKSATERTMARSNDLFDHVERRACCDDMAGAGGALLDGHLDGRPPAKEPRGDPCRRHVPRAAEKGDDVLCYFERHVHQPTLVSRLYLRGLGVHRVFFLSFFIPFWLPRLWCGC